MDNIFVVWTADLRKSDYVVPTPKDLWLLFQEQSFDIERENEN